MSSGFLRPVALRFALCSGLLSGAVSWAEAGSSNGLRGEECIAADLEPCAAQLKRLKTAAEVEAWLAREVPEGLSLAEAPEFFAAADEVFLSAEEGLFLYVYRSAATGRWTAWVAFDADRTGVVHTAAIDLGH